jgi:hypothetical protein
MTPVRGPRRTPRYVCRRYQGGGGCTSAHACPVDVVEAAVVRAWVVEAGIPEREWVAEVLAAERTRPSRTVRPTADRRTVARGRLDRALAAGWLSAERYRAAVTRLEQALPESVCRDPPTDSEAEGVSPDAVLEAWPTLAERFCRGTDVAVRRELIRRYVERIDVLPGRLVLRWREGDPDASAPEA